MLLIVCPLSHVPSVCAARRPSHLITLIDPDTPVETPAGLAAGRHLRLGINDIDAAEEGLVCPDETTVEKILQFGADWDEVDPIVIHCWAGISRSTATAYMLACERSPAGAELEIARALRAASPTASPNRRLVRLADEALGRKGRMVAAIDSIGRGDFAYEAKPFELRARW